MKGWTNEDTYRLAMSINNNFKIYSLCKGSKNWKEAKKKLIMNGYRSMLNMTPNVNVKELDELIVNL